MTLKTCSLFALAVALVLTPLAKADTVSASLVLDPSGPPTYIYDLNVGDGIIDVQSFTLTGLAGVTNAVLVDTLKGDFDVTFTSTSVTVTDSDGSPSYEEGSFGDLKVYSTFAPGTVHYTIFQDNHDPISGTVTGPVGSPVPEPSSLALLGSGILGMAGMLRRKFLA
jgi:hypothetical protein